MDKFCNPMLRSELQKVHILALIGKKALIEIGQWNADFDIAFLALEKTIADAKDSKSNLKDAPKYFDPSNIRMRDFEMPFKDKL